MLGQGEVPVQHNQFIEPAADMIPIEQAIAEAAAEAENDTESDDDDDDDNAMVNGTDPGAAFEDPDVGYNGVVDFESVIPRHHHFWPALWDLLAGRVNWDRRAFTLPDDLFPTFYADNIGGSLGRELLLLWNTVRPLFMVDDGVASVHPPAPAPI